MGSRRLPLIRPHAQPGELAQKALDVLISRWSSSRSIRCCPIRRAEIPPAVAPVDEEVVAPSSTGYDVREMADGPDFRLLVGGQKWH